MSPEQVEGKTELDGRSDIYGLGIIFYEMLTGERPYEGDSAINIVLQHLQSPLPRLPAEYQVYQPLLNLMLAKRREDRFPDAERLKSYLLGLQGPPGGQTDPAAGGYGAPGQGATPRRYTGGHITQQLAIIRRRRLRTWLVVSAAVLAISGMLAWYFTSELHRYDALAVTPVSPYRSQPEAGAGGQDGTDLGPMETQVITALTWLARRSLEERRLTTPPEDNAYYYYSRLLELDPGNPVGVKGIAEVARRFADLAEEAARNKEYDLAERYIVQGLFVDPENKRLQVLRSNLLLRERGLLETLLGLF
jgi:serine/threonine-protein kinase PpkA